MSIIATYHNVITGFSSLGTSGALAMIGIGISVIATIALFYQYRQSQQLQTKLERLEHDLRIMNGNAIGMGQQLIELEKRSHSVNVTTQAAKQNQVNTTTEEKPVEESEKSGNHVYDEARALLSQGYNVNEVAKECGLSYAEVSLLNTLARQASAV